LAHSQGRLNDAVDQLDVADEPLEVEGVETDQPCVGVQQFVIQDERNVKLRIAGQAEARGLIPRVELVEYEVEAFQPLVSILRGVVYAVIVVPQRAQGFIDVAVRLMVGSEPGLLRREVVIEVLPAEEPAAGTAVALWSGVEVVQVRGHLRYAEAAILALVRQLDEAANHPRGLIVGDDGGTGEGGYVAGRRSAQVVSPNGLRRNVCIRSDPEIRIGPDALDEKLLRLILVEKLESVRTGNQRTVELAASLKGKAGCGIDSIVGTDCRVRLQSGIGQRTRL